MKLDRYWIAEKRKVLIEGAEQESACFGVGRLVEQVRAGGLLNDFIRFDEYIPALNFRQPLACA